MIGTGAEPRERPDLGQLDSAVVGAVVVVAVQLGHRRPRPQHQQGSGGGHRRLDHGRALGDQGAPVVVPGGHGGGRHHPAAIGVQGGHADDLVAHHLERGHRLQAFDHGRARPGVAVDQVDVDARPAERRVDQQPAAVTRQRHVGPGRLVRQVVPHHLVLVGRIAQAVPEHLAPVVQLVVGHLAGQRIAGIGEPEAVGSPGHRRGTGVGDGVGMAGARAHVEDVEGGALVAVGGQAVGQPRAVGRGVVPVDGRGGVTGQQDRIDDGAGQARPAGRAHHQHRLVVMAPPVEREHPVAGYRAAHRGPGAQQRAQAPVQPGPSRPVVQVGPGVRVLRLDPGLGLGILAVLEPAERVRDPGAVQLLDDLAAPCGRRRSQRVRAQPRPALGLRPWFAFLRRALVLRLAVFFDIRRPRYRARAPAGKSRGPRCDTSPTGFGHARAPWCLMKQLWNRYRR